MSDSLRGEAMARGKKGIDGVDRVIDLFPAGSAKMIDRLLKRAAEKEAKKAGRDVKRAMQSLSSGGRSGNRLIGGLARELGKALKQRGDVGRNRTSVRQKAPDTGGRPFHFAHSHVNKSGVKPAGSLKSTASGTTGRAAAHMRYIERDTAVERLGSIVRGREAAVENADFNGPERDGTGAGASRSMQEASHATGSAPGQAYIENPTKLENGETVIFSFGTIGDRFDDRVAFWEALEQAEYREAARVQQRLIVELPHEASPQARFEMVKSLCRRFDDDGIPYWATLHAPGAKNDSRNYHAHVVFSERPAKKVVDPATGREDWDFAILRSHKKKSRNVVTTRPYRQEKLRAYTAKAFIPSLRKDFSDAVNVILARDDVKSATGEPVRYDARSYKTMGVDVVPMRSINRIVADKMKDGTATILDGDYTKRMITAELREAAARRDKGVMELVELDRLLDETTKAKSPNAKLRSLPKDLRGSTLAIIPRPVLKAAGKAILEARRSALQIDVMEKATTASLERVIAATAPKAVAAAAAARDPVKKAEAPEREAAALLHAAALEELAETKASAAKARKTARYAVGRAMNAWKDIVDAPLPTASAATKAAIEWATERRHAPAVAPQRQATMTRETGRSDAASSRGALSEASSRPRSERAPSTGRPSQKKAAPPSALYEGQKKGGHIFEPLKMPKWLDDMNEGISRMIKVATKTEPDVDKRMDALEDMVYQMQLSNRASKGPRPPGSPPLPEIQRISMRAAVPHSAGPTQAEFDAKWAAERRVDDAKAAREEAPTTSTPASNVDAKGIGRSPPANEQKSPSIGPDPIAPEQQVAKPAEKDPISENPTPAGPEVKAVPAQPSKPRMNETAPTQSAPSSKEDPGKPSRVAPTSTAKHDVAQPELASLIAGSKARPDLMTRTPAPSLPDTTEKDAPTPKPPAPADRELEHPSDAKRRKAFEDEEKRRKKRRAVLAKRNLDISR